MKLSLGISPCPNDTFMFFALFNQLIDMKGYTFTCIFDDIEALNKMALKHELDVTKISFNAYTSISNHYQLLNSGSALGHGNGPLVISKHKIFPDELHDAHIAIPGENTTANLLMSIAFPEAQNKTSYLFSDIEDVVLSGEQDAGLIIHENRFTYQAKGLQKVVDLGVYWEETYQLPIPLGGFAIKNTLTEKTKKDVNMLIKNSILYAYEHFRESLPFIRKHAQATSDEVIKQHIHLYVNDYSVDLGKKGREAIEKLYEIGHQKGIIRQLQKNILALPLF